MIKDENYDALTKLTTICKCGHSMIIKNKRGRLTCKYCGRLVFVSIRAKMKYRKLGIISRLKKDLEVK